MFVVAGVTGHVGSVVAQELLAAGEEVKVLVREVAKGEVWKKRGAQVAVADLADAEALASALRGAEGAFLLLPTHSGAVPYIATLRKVADALVEGVTRSQIPHVVLLSSAGAHLPEGTGPVKVLHQLENGLRASGTKLTALRASSFQENIGGALGSAKAAGIYPNMSGPDHDLARPQVAARDIASLAAHELRFPSPQSDVLDLHGPAYSTAQLAEKVSQKLGRQLEIVDIPPEKYVATCLQAGLSQEEAEAFAEMHAALHAGKMKPVGDRFKQGRTGIDTLLASWG